MKNKIKVRGRRSLVLYIEGAQSFLHPFPYFRVRLRVVDLTRSEARTGFALRVRAVGALCPVWRIGREFRPALVALIVGDRLGTELVARIAVGILVFLGAAVNRSVTCIGANSRI